MATSQRAACNVAQAITPAITSSIIMPRPPFTFLSNTLTGHGLTMSNTRNTTKPAAIYNHSAGMAHMVIQYPTNSSQTIPG